MSLQSWQETLFVLPAAGATLSAASAASMLTSGGPRLTFPANYFNTLGKTVLIEASGQISSVITTPGTARYDVYFGGATVVADSLAVLLDTVAAHTAVPWYLRMLLTLRATGTSANFMMVGTWCCESILGTASSMPKADGVALIPWNATPAVSNNFDSTAAQTCDLRFTQTVATGSMTCHQAVITSLN